MDETLDVLAAHGIAGLTGILFIGFFAQESWNGVADGLLYGDAEQLGWQALAAVAAPVYAFVRDVRAAAASSARSCRCAPATTRRRSGMDVVQHGEEAYATGEGAILIEPEFAAPSGRRAAPRRRAPGASRGRLAARAATPLDLDRRAVARARA